MCRAFYISGPSALILGGVLFGGVHLHRDPGRPAVPGGVAGRRVVSPRNRAAFDCNARFGRVTLRLPARTQNFIHFITNYTTYSIWWYIPFYSL